jgi:alpha-glucosidase
VFYRHEHHLSALLLYLIGTTSAATAADERELSVVSPNGTVSLAVQVGGQSGGVRFSVTRSDRPVIESSTLDIRLAKHGSLARGATVVKVDERRIDEWIDLPWGKASRIRHHGREVTIRFKCGNGVEWELELRAYDDGAAFRYGLTKQDKLGQFVIESENTEFRLANDPNLLFMTLKGFTTSHESTYQRMPLSKLATDELIEMPLLATWPNGTAAAITEAGLRNFAGMYLERANSDGKNTLRSRHSPLPGKTNVVVEANTPQWSPWRAVLLAGHAGTLIESNLLVCLNDPPNSDFSWVKPGKTTFHWWNGEVEHGPPSTPESNFAIHKKYIDFCADHGITYHTVISVSGNRPWFVQREPGFAAPHPDTDILAARPDIDLPRILAYANEKGVNIRFWVHWKPLSEHLDEAFAQYERWGIKGLMVDFMDRDDQEMVAWQERCLEAAARHRLHIQFHGSYKPTGEHRTYPNLFNREGVLNEEYLKWSDACTPAHTVNVAYTRSLAGLTDYHLGGFRAATRTAFQSRDENPLVMGTRCFQLALYVVFDNPMPMLADRPESYKDQPGFDFLVDVPTTWDETRFVAGEPGEFVVVARRNGRNWYLGGITNWTKRELNLPLTFLNTGEFAAHLYLDGSLDGEQPNEIRQKEQLVSAATTLKVKLASGGGIAAVFRPTSDRQ